MHSQTVNITTVTEEGIYKIAFVLQHGWHFDYEGIWKHSNGYDVHYGDVETLYWNIVRENPRWPGDSG